MSRLFMILTALMLLLIPQAFATNEYIFGRFDSNLADSGLSGGNFSSVGSIMYSTSIFKTGSASINFSNSYVNKSTGSTFNIASTNGTIAMWVRPLNLTATYIYTDTSDYSTRVIAISTESGGGSSCGGGTSEDVIYFGSSTYQDGCLAAGNWTHFVFTWKNGNYTLYRNGVVKTSQTGITGTLNSNMFIGKETAHSLIFYGYVDDVRFYNSTYFNSTDVSALYNGGNGTDLEYPFTGVPSADIRRYQQIPADLNVSNLFSGINITMNSSYVNRSKLLLYWKTNDSNDPCGFYVNGVSYCGMFNDTASANYSLGSSNITEFRLNADYVFPGTYNMHPSYMDNVQNINISVGNNNAFLKTRFYNVTAVSQYFDVEVMAINLSTTAMHIWYCNSSYTTGSVSSSPYCTNFADLSATAWDHCHSAYSCHFKVPMIVSNQTLNGVKVTSLSYLLLQGGGQWNYFYIANDTGSLAGTLNGGTSWTSLPYTTNQHIHQYSNTTTLRYYASDGSTSSPIYTDTLDAEPQDPSSAVIITPTAGTYDNELINVSFLNATTSLNSGSIESYVILLLENQTLNTIDTFLIGLNNSYAFNSSAYPDGDYLVDVQAYSTIGRDSHSYSDTFRIANSAPAPSEIAVAIDTAMNKLMFVLLLLLCAVSYFLSIVPLGNESTKASTSLFLKVISLSSSALSYVYAPTSPAQNVSFALTMFMLVIIIVYILNEA